MIRDSWTEKNSSAVPDYDFGAWVANNPAGIRFHRYSTSSYVDTIGCEDRLITFSGIGASIPCSTPTHLNRTSTVSDPQKSLAGNPSSKFTTSIGIGEVWANTLHNVYAALIQAHGFSATAATNPSGTEGNIVYLHLFIDALPIQPCNPTCT